MGRQRTLVLLAAIVVASGIALRLAWPSQQSALPCAPELVRWDDAGVARCGEAGEPTGAVPPGPGLTLGLKLNLNHASEDDLARLAGIGAQAAHELVRARSERGGFRSWDEVDAVPGIGPARLSALQGATEIGP